MKSFQELWKPFLTKEKLFILTVIFILINISILTTYQQSFLSTPGYIQDAPQAGLKFFYDLFCIGANPFLFILFMLLLPNLVSYDFLNSQQTHLSYPIETRLKKKHYYHDIFIKNIIMSFLIILILYISILLIIHFFYAPIQFNTMVYPEGYYITTQIFTTHELLNLIIFILFTSMGYALISSFIFSLQIFISNKYIYRCCGVIIGILLVLIPALIQGYLPNPDIAFLFQIDNLVAIGIQNLRANPFGMSNLVLFLTSFILYSALSYFAFQCLMKWRQHYD